MFVGLPVGPPLRFELRHAWIEWVVVIVHSLRALEREGRNESVDLLGFELVEACFAVLKWIVKRLLKMKDYVHWVQFALLLSMSMT